MLNDASWLVAIGPIMGWFLLWMKKQEWIKGLWLLLTAILASAAVVASYGWAQGWTTAQWHQLPMAVLMLVSTSSLTSSTTQAVVDVVRPENRQDIS